MKVQPSHRIAAVAALCVAALIALVVNEGVARQSGQEALLPMEAIDPRSPLSGHYVQLNLMERLAPNTPCPQVESGSDWIAFTRDADGALSFAGAATSRDGAQQIGPVLIEGTFTCSEPVTGVDGAEGMPGWVRLDLGIDRFHINQTDALRIERILSEQRPNQETRAFAIVSVSRDGTARLKGLMIDGERLELTWL